ncbi:hypothetical protein JVT61DRAFT_14475 [Boletus reticuloceps]|uniref:Uncharacterized protein n=1 Tax=Boletus reticuloceps TaxID=495285 RepID=A0A8I3ACU6_9AGAM|nr:hypothetical protein JVT61DRAFT_14475 [Boletus reticuloceps]
MFASLSSFLPSALQQVALVGARPPDVLSPPPPTPPDPDTPVVDPPRKKEKKEKHPNEAFIIVRPPPSKSAQPLSLQVQLVPPQSRNERPVQALDTSPDDLNTDLKRIHSNGSEASAYSVCTSVGSVSSFASTSTSSGRRTIIPLYNLNVHSVMPTTILDAGTDAKVAKFARRGLEVIGLAFLEPIEVRPSSPANGSLAAVSARASLDDSFREFGAASGTSSRRPASPARPNTTHVTINAPGDHLHIPAINLPLAPPLPPPDMPPPQRSTNKLFTRMFKKKGTASHLYVAVPLPDEVTTPHSPPLRTSARISEDTSTSRPDTPRHDAWPCTPLTSTTISQTAVLGVYSTLYPPVSNPTGRPTKYIWVVRKWLKGSDTSILNGMMGKLSVGAREASVPDAPHAEVRFEWFRERKKGNSRKTRNRRSDSPSRRQVPSNTLPRPAPQTLSPDSHDHRSSIASHNSSSSDTAASLSSSAQRDAEESGEESDPEDSETAWTCTVTVQRPEQLTQKHRNGSRAPVIRLKVATLAPTPHHPKVVGLLKTPFPLPDIEVERLVVRRRFVTAQGLSKTTAPNAGGFVLTAEEIKDTVSSTALWLVVREAFGGVGRERKKGKS